MKCAVLCGVVVFMGFFANGQQRPPRERIEREPAFVTGWLYLGAGTTWQEILTSVGDNLRILGEVSPVWYFAVSDGSVVQRPKAPVDDPTLLAMIYAPGTAAARPREERPLLRPIIQNEDASGFNVNITLSILQDPVKMAFHASALANLVMQRNYDGIDIDYESFTAAQVPLLAPFIEMLVKAVHQIPEGSIGPRTVAVDIAPRYFGVTAATTRALARIGVAADSVRILLYPEHTASTPPGPIASLSWIEQRLALVKQVIPLEKVSLGMATYALLWNPTGSATWVDLIEPAIAQGIPISRDGDGVPSFTTKAGQIVYFEDATSIARKIAVAQSFGVHRFALWRLGGEDPSLWRDFDFKLPSPREPR